MGPVTKLGRLVKEGKIQTLEDIYLHSLPIKEFQIVDNFFAPGTLKDDVMKIHPVQKMSAAGQTNRFVAFVLVGDCNGHLDWGPSVPKRWPLRFAVESSPPSWPSSPSDEDTGEIN